MSRLIKVIFVIIIQTLSLLAIDSNRIKIWRDFIENPNRVNMIVCLNEIEITMRDNKFKTGYYNTELDSIISDRRTNGEPYLWEIIVLTEKGNIFAAELLFKLYWFYDGNPEVSQFINEYLGDFSEKEPVRFLELLNKYQPPKGHYKNSVYYCNKTSLNHRGLSTQDEIKHLELRRDLMNSIEVDSLATVKIQYLKCIDEQIDKLSEYMKWEQNRKRSNK